MDQPNLKLLHRLATSTSALLRNKNSQWVEYGAIDDSIIEKLKDDEDVRVRLQVSDISHDLTIRHQTVLGITAEMFSFTDKYCVSAGCGGAERGCEGDEGRVRADAADAPLPQLPRLDARGAELQDEPPHPRDLRMPGGEDADQG